MGRSLAARIHNPHARVCFCDPDCWCRRTAIGRLVKWWLPARYFPIPHKSERIEAWRKGLLAEEWREWKRRRAEGSLQQD